MLVLISMTAVAVVSTIPSSKNDESKKYAQSFYQRLLLLNEEAVLSGKDFGLYFNEKKSNYELLILEPEGWQDLNLGKIPSKTELKDDIVLQLTVGGGVWQDEDRLFKPGSLFDEEMFAEFEDEKEKKRKPPQVFVLSSGELTPFVVSFYPENEDARDDGWRVRVKDSGEVIMLAPGEEEDES